MNLIGRKRIQSQILPDVWFNVKSLSLIERGEREMAILKQRAEYRRAIQARISALDKAIGKDESDRLPEEQREAYNKARAEKFETAPVEVSQEVDECYERELAILYSAIMPAVLKAGLVGIEGLQFENKQVLTVEDFIRIPNDKLLMEAYRLCDSASSLTDEQAKN